LDEEEKLSEKINHTVVKVAPDFSPVKDKLSKNEAQARIKALKKEVIQL